MPMFQHGATMQGMAETEFFRTILETLHTGVYVIDRDAKIVFWNDGAERVTGYLRQDVIGRICDDNFLG
jgi:PAS domain S-box-containing protein